MEFFLSLIPLVSKFFFVTNPIGNTPTIISLVKDYDFAKQKRIMIREGIFALLIALFFQFFGEFFLGLLNIQDYALTLCGGSLLLIVAFSMIFNVEQPTDIQKPKAEPFIVPIATPILTGPGLMAMIMLYSRIENNQLKITAAILVAWVGILSVLAVGPYLQRVFGKRGLVALEQLMGMILAFISTEMLVNGVSLFLKNFKGN